MSTPGPHALLPSLTHDERSREDFVISLRRDVVGQARTGCRVAFENRASVAFEKRQGRAPADRHDVRNAMLRDSYGQVSSSLRLLTQELMWASLAEPVERQSDRLSSLYGARHVPKRLEIDPELEIPRYQSALDIHIMPGSYNAEASSDDVYAGALYDLGAFGRAAGSIGPYCEDFGESLGDYLKEAFPDFRPTTILDVGCSIGHSAVALQDAWPKATIHGIDLAAPLLRYGHARAESMSKKIHFSQQNAEATRFADESFDLVVSFATLHETSDKAVRRILAEVNRVLKPGGLTLHLEGQPWNQMGPFDAWVHDWDTHYNAEPFIGRLHDIDPQQLMTDAGFDEESYVEVSVPSAGLTRGRSGHLGTASAKAKVGSYWFFGAWK